MAMKTVKQERLHEPSYEDKVMTVLWLGFMLFGLALCAILILKVILYKGDPKVEPYIKAQNRKEKITPVRGDILDCKDRILATSTFTYTVRLDTRGPADAKEKHDTLWNNNVHKLAAALSEHFKDKTAAEYLDILESGHRKRNAYLLIKKNIKQTEIEQVRQMPIFNKRNLGGYIEERNQKRLYPYNSAAKSTIGFVVNNNDSIPTGEGIEICYNGQLHGKDGIQMMRRCDFGKVPVMDKENRKAENGQDIRTTIDIDIQNIADIALNRVVSQNYLIEKSCVIVLDVKTGAVKAMVNLGRNANGELGEFGNYAIRNSESPGSVFKGVVLMALLEDGYITSLENRIPTYGGHWKYRGIEFNDTKHLSRSRFPSGYIKIREAFEMSANNPFRQLICDKDTYDSNPMRFIEKIKGFGLFDDIDFDLKGNVKPFILDPTMKKMSSKGSWDGGTFPRMAIGYNMEISPLNLVTFYNAIANDGKMMKPYLIDAIMQDGKVKEQFEPSVMHEQICTQRTVDTLKRAMSLVTTNKGGTAYWQLHNAVCPVAGKTGTAQRLFKMSNGKFGFHDNNTGEESQQGSFIGFFPLDNPKYTAIVVIWGKPTAGNFYGATYAAPVFREIADKIYCLNKD